MGDAETIRVFLLDDHEVVRRGVRELLDAEDDIEVVGEAGTAERGTGAHPGHRPDVAILDVRLPDGDGIEVCREIRSGTASIACLMLTSFSDDEALFAGDHGRRVRLPAQADPGHRHRRRRARVAAGRVAARPGGHRRVPNGCAARRRRTNGWPASPARSARSSTLIAEGLTNRQIGDELHLAEKTVKNYVSNLLAKLGMERRTPGRGVRGPARTVEHRGLVPATSAAGRVARGLGTAGRSRNDGTAAREPVGTVTVRKRMHVGRR